MSERNLTMMTDLYQLTMMYGYQKHGMGENEAVFDMFFREVGGPNCYAMVAGLEQLIEYIDNLKFTEEDLAYLRSLNQFDEGFLDRCGEISIDGNLSEHTEF